MTINDQIACVKREISMRERVYPKWVGSGKMRSDKAAHEINAMKEVLATLEQIAKSTPFSLEG